MGIGFQFLKPINSNSPFEASTPPPGCLAAVPRQPWQPTKDPKPRTPTSAKVRYTRNGHMLPAPREYKVPFLGAEQSPALVSRIAESSIMRNQFERVPVGECRASPIPTASRARPVVS